MPRDYIIKRIDDRSLLRLFQEAKNAGEKALATAVDDLVGTSHKIQLSFHTGLPWKTTEEDIQASLPGQFTLSIIYLDFSATYQGNKSESVKFIVKRGENNALVDTFELSNSSPLHAMNGEGEQLVQKAIHVALSSLLQPVAPEDGGLIPTLSNLSESFNTTFQKISEELSASVAAVNQERSALLADLQAERGRQQKEIAEERATLLKEARDEIEKQRAELQEEQQRLEEDWAKLEISSHKDARRKQFSKLQEDLSVALSEPIADAGLRTTRWAVFVALCSAGAAAMLFGYWNISTAPAETTTVGWLLPVIRTVALSFASLASFVGAAAWLRYFYIKDYQTQEDMRRFRNDMARASWVMDAALEIRKEHDEEIPPEWIVGVTEGLFAAQKRETLEEGAQALAALMGLSASARFGPNGPSIELTRKGGKAISSAVKNAE